MSLKHSQNKGSPHFPHDYPDCPAGARFQEQQEIELLNKFKRSVTFVEQQLRCCKQTTRDDTPTKDKNVPCKSELL